MSVQEYSRYYQDKLEQGRQFQDHVNTLLYERGIVVVQYQSKRYQFERGENSGGNEIKLDTRLRETGHLYIEIAEKSHPSNPAYIPSGAYRDDHWLYAIGDYQTVYVFLSRHLRLLHQRGLCAEKQTPTSKGFILPEAGARKYAAAIFSSEESPQMNLTLC